MSEIDESSQLESFLDIYDTLLIFRIPREGKERTVTVCIRQSKKESHRKRKFPFPDNIDERELVWGSYQGDKISVYHRKGANIYCRSGVHITEPTMLTKKMERIFLRAYKGITEQP